MTVTARLHGICAAVICQCSLIVDRPGGRSDQRANSGLLGDRQIELGVDRLAWSIAMRSNELDRVIRRARH
jgi:hypothetical protein